ncbi:phospholipase A2, membrane associated-like isoform X2 [Hyperolius riggenbachi]
MITRVVRRSPFSYVYYGCHCGLGGRGIPVDDTDWCCHSHDCCFESLIISGCDPYKKSYKFSYSNNNLLCSPWNLNECARKTCECDRAAALCFKRHKKSYSIWNYGIRKTHRCDQPTPACDFTQLPIH